MSVPSIQGGERRSERVPTWPLHFLPALRRRRHALAGAGAGHRDFYGLPRWQTTSRYPYHRSMAAERRPERVTTGPLLIPLRARRARDRRGACPGLGCRGRTCVYLYSTVRWIQIMKPVWSHSVECQEYDRPPGQSARTRGRPQRYTQARNRECPGMTDLAVVSGQLGVKLAC